MKLQDIVNIANGLTDEDYTVDEAVNWVNSAIAKINTYEPFTKLPYYSATGSATVTYDDNGTEKANTYIAYTVDYPLNDAWIRLVIAYATAVEMKIFDGATLEARTLETQYKQDLAKMKGKLGFDTTLFLEFPIEDVTEQDGIYIENGKYYDFGGGWD